MRLQKKVVWKLINKKKRKVIRSVCWSKQKVNEQFGEERNDSVSGNRKLFWKEVGNGNSGKEKSAAE